MQHLSILALLSGALGPGRAAVAGADLSEPGLAQADGEWDRSSSICLSSTGLGTHARRPWARSAAA
jgi:hypothetical protein